MERKCLRCGKPFKKRGIKKFCSLECRTRYNALKRHHFLWKTSPEYREYRKRIFKKWKKKNREHYNDLMREGNRIRGRKIFKERKERGLCIGCGGERDSEFARCSRCLKRQRKYDRRWKEKERSRMWERMLGG